MNNQYNDIKSIEIPINILPKNQDYKFGINILKKFNLCADEWTLFYHNNSE